jgi:low affinity Fe/Cu permease
MAAQYRRDMNRLRERFDHLADRVTIILGSAEALIASVTVVAVWAITGPIFSFSDTWQLFINTTTTVVTFWMVFVIQNSQNRQSKATQLKLDELIRAMEGARNRFIELDSASADELADRERELVALAHRHPQGEVVDVTGGIDHGDSGTRRSKGRLGSPHGAVRGPAHGCASPRPRPSGPDRRLWHVPDALGRRVP